MGGKPSKSACKIRGIRIIGVENPSHSVQIIIKFTIFSEIYAKKLTHPTVDLDLAIQTEREAIRFQFPASRVRKS